ncbi:hypothetical protein DFH09DRAFT_1104473 [Mycena vulgaris]|nr:hypothetical protein DFH09DRAFT_1104473 [Mycena vulgaris]
MAHLAGHWDTPQDLTAEQRSTCVAHNAVDKPDRDARGTASSGIGAVDCAQHNMKRPLSVGDLQFGERYINIDYMFFRSLSGTELVRFYVSYDIACQWHINIWTRMDTYQQELRMVDNEKFVVFLVPKFHLPAHIEACNLRFSFNLTRDVGQTDGEAPERGWANANPLAGSTKEMGPGARCDTLNEHFNDWNWKKIIAFGCVMLKKTRTAVPEMVATKVALNDMEASLHAAGAHEEAEAVEMWTKVATVWEEDPEAPNPFETLNKDDHLAKVRRDLAEEAAARAEAGEEEEGEVMGDMHVTEIIAMGLQVEGQQRALGFDVAGVGLHPTDDQRRTMVKRTSKLRRKIQAWMDSQERFIPHIITLRQRDDAGRARAARMQPVPGVQVQSIKLWMPSNMMRQPGTRRRPHCTCEVQEFEYRLRVGQANEALHNICCQLLVRMHMYKYKDKNKRGSLEEDAWEVTLKELKDEDVSREEEGPEEEDEERATAVMDLGGADKGCTLQIEWAKVRARSIRWSEEVDLLEEEMRRIVQFLTWRADWWEGRIDLRELPEGPQREGETAYAVKQARILMKLRDAFLTKWVALPEVIKKGRAGEDVQGVEGTEWEDEDSGSEAGSVDTGEGDSKGEPVPDSAGRPIKSTYVDV